MTNQTKHFIGMVMWILGLILIVLNAIDYIVGWNQIESGVSGIGLMLILFGLGLYRFNRENPQQ